MSKPRLLDAPSFGRVGLEDVPGNDAMGEHVVILVV
jgi:hypothetical protein